jgi:hypothetical protein
LGLNWYQLNDIKGRAVERGIARRADETVRNVGIDEKQFLKVARAWALKEQFRPFWSFPNKERAEAHFDGWYS